MPSGSSWGDMHRDIDAAVIKLIQLHISKVVQIVQEAISFLHGSSSVRLGAKITALEQDFTYVPPSVLAG